MVNDHDYYFTNVAGINLNYVKGVDENLQFMEKLKADIEEIKRLIPAEAWEKLKSVEIYANLKYYYNGK